MDLGLADKVAIVCAASRGMGRATAAALVREGARIAMCARHEDELHQAAQEIGGSQWQERVLPIVADVSQSGDIERLVAETLRHWGRIDIAVNNTGGPPPGQPLAMSDADWLSAFEVQFFSVVRLCREVVPHMQQQGWGRIVNILSLTVRQPEDNIALSTVARSSAVAFAKTLSTEVARDGITVNNVLPGSVDMARIHAVAEMQAIFRGRDIEHALEDLLALLPVGRLGMAE